MRPCPNCSQEIQDEAVYCRYCHTELELPLWLASMRKCPNCAEWIENDAERCKYCDRSLFVADAPHTAPFVDTSSPPEDFTQALRQNLLDDDSEEAAAIAAAAAEFVADEPSLPMAGFDAAASFSSEFPQDGAPSDPGLEASFYDEPRSELRRSLYDEPLESALPEESAEDVEADMQDEPQEGTPYDASFGGAEAALYEEPQSDLRGSLYDEPLEEDVTEEPSTYYASETVRDDEIEYIEPPVAAGAGTDSSIWMAGAEAEDDEYVGATGPHTSAEDSFGRSTAGTEGVSELRDEASGPPGQIRRVAGKVARTVIIIAVLGAAIWGLVVISQGPAGAFITEALATDIPTETPIPEPTSTRRPAPTLPPVTEESATADPALLPTGIGTSSSDRGCVLWEAITIDDEGAEVCAYGIIKRWWAGDDIPFIAIFTEEQGTFAIIDRSTRHPVGPGSCIMARGTVEVMGGVRPNIDAQGVLEECPADFVEG